MEILGTILTFLLCALVLLPTYSSHLLVVIRAIGDAIATARFGECECDDGDDGEEDETSDHVPPPPGTASKPTVSVN